MALVTRIHQKIILLLLNIPCNDVNMLEKPEGATRLVTFNIRHGAYDGKNNYEGRPDQVGEACQEFDADILALQEVDNGIRRSKSKHLGEIAAEATGMQLIFEPTMPFRGGQYGNALLVRGEIIWADALQLTHGYRFGVKKEPRNAIMARVRVANQIIDVAATHLSTQKRVSRKQLPEIMADLNDEPFPRVILGDFNRSYRQVLPFLDGETALVKNKEASYPANQPKKLIDHVALRGLEVVQSQTIQMQISDHRARVVDVR